MTNERILPTPAEGLANIIAAAKGDGWSSEEYDGWQDLPQYDEEGNFNDFYSGGDDDNDNG